MILLKWLFVPNSSNDVHMHQTPDNEKRSNEFETVISGTKDGSSILGSTKWVASSGSWASDTILNILNAQTHQPVFSNNNNNSSVPVE